jgi:hypothetical protein
VRSIGSCKAEGDTITKWISFLEETWKLQCSHMQLKDDQTKYMLTYCLLCIFYLCSEFSLIVEHNRTIVFDS